MEKVLKGHVSAETAYVVDDYPYGYTLRCKIRYWLEFHPKRGFRFVSQTTNPKAAVERWNKPKASTYNQTPAVMYLDAEGHVHWSGCPTEGDKAAAWWDRVAAGGLDGEALTSAVALALAGVRYCERRAAGEYAFTMNGVAYEDSPEDVERNERNLAGWRKLLDVSKAAMAAEGKAA